MGIRLGFSVSSFRVGVRFFSFFYVVFLSGDRRGDACGRAGFGLGGADVFGRVEKVVGTDVSV